MTLDHWEFAGEFKALNLRFRNADGAFIRECRPPGTAVDDLPEDVQRAAREAWTADIVQSYAALVIPRPQRADSRDEKIAKLEARLDQIEATAKTARTP